MRHLWNKIDDTCKRCGLKRKLSYNGDGFQSRIGDRYVYWVNNKWIKELPNCIDKTKSTYDKLFDFNESNKRNKTS